LGCVIQQFSHMYHIILSSQQVFVGKNQTEYNTKFTDVKECNFIIKAYSEMNRLLQDKEVKNHYVSEEYLKKEYTFYIEANTIKEAINTVNRHFKNIYGREVQSFVEELKLETYNAFLEEEAFDVSLAIQEKVVFGWEVINVQDTQTFSLDKSKNLV